jgi:hypothetical protein
MDEQQQEPKRRRRPQKKPASPVTEATRTIGEDERIDRELEATEKKLAELRAKRAERGNGAQPLPERAPMREQVRGEMREESSREEAERIANAYLALHGHEDNVEYHDDFDVKRLVTAPDGWEYNWKRRQVRGWEDPSYEAELTQKGWRCVPASRHPELVPPTGHYELIEKRGMVLMECPMILTERARLLDQRRALDRLETNRRKLAAAPPGQFQDRTGGRLGANPVIKRTYETLPQDAKPRTPGEKPPLEVPPA